MMRVIGNAGGHDALRRYASDWKRVEGSRTAAAFVPLALAPGEAFRFDWSHEVLPIDGVTAAVKVAHV